MSEASGLKTRCERVAREYIPAIRSLVSTILVREYGLTQIETAKKLGTTQPAVSYYLRSKRGAKLIEDLKSDRKIFNMIKSLARLVYEGKMDEARKMLCEICRTIEI